MQSKGCSVSDVSPSSVRQKTSHGPTRGMKTSSVVGEGSAAPLPRSAWIMPRLKPYAGSAMFGLGSGGSSRSTTPMPTRSILKRLLPGSLLSTKASSYPRSVPKRATKRSISDTETSLGSATALLSNPPSACAVRLVASVRCAPRRSVSTQRVPAGGVQCDISTGSVI
jgi:hypothetical protein